MTKKEIIKGIEYRLESLNDALEVLDGALNDGLSDPIRDFEIRIDELDSLLVWIKEDSKEIP